MCCYHALSLLITNSSLQYVNTYPSKPTILLQHLSAIDFFYSCLYTEDSEFLIGFNNKNEHGEISVLTICNPV